MRIRLLISYDGTPFGGWQKQKSEKPTVQGTLEQALAKLFNQKISTVGSGRTDAGVHAIGQVVHFDIPHFPKGLQLIRALNSLTPPELVIRRAWTAPDEFHALLSAEKKIYKYRIYNSPTPSAFLARYTTWVRTPLDVGQLNQICSPLLGEHDFKSFQTSGTEVPSTKRCISQIEWKQKSRFIVELTIEGSGFLKQMVRNIVGTCLDLHKKRLNDRQMEAILASRDRTQALSTAPTRGLYLYRVIYPRPLDNKCRKI